MREFALLRGRRIDINIRSRGCIDDGAWARGFDDRDRSHLTCSEHYCHGV